MLAVAIALLLGFLSVTALLLLGYIRWHYGELEKLGIPVVTPHFIFGSTANKETVINHEEHYKWLKTHGEVFGVYEGRVPQVYVCDPDIVRRVFIKDAEKFPNKVNNEILDFGAMSREWMDILKGEKWKVVRSAFSPIFTSAKLKRLSHHMLQVTEEMAETIMADVNKAGGSIQDFDLYQEIYLMMIDLTARVTSNIKVENPRDPNNDFAKALKMLFQGASETSGIVKKLKAILPFLNNMSHSKSMDYSTGFFQQVYKQVLKARMDSGETKDDFVDFMIDIMKRVDTDEFRRLGITERTIIANAVAFYLGGQDNTAMSVSMLAFYMSKKPEIERKLYEEVDAYFERHNGKVTYETFHELVYLNACLQEALRLHPVFIRTSRKCIQDTEIKGLKFKKGMDVVVPIWAYNRNPKYHHDPDTFNPERFMPDSKDKVNPMAVATFGWGPRMCIGVRFATEIVLSTSVYLLKNFRFTTKPNAQVKYIPGLELAYAQKIPLDVHLR